MPKKQIVQVNLAAANPNLSPATRFGNLVFVAGQTGRHPITGEVGSDVREQTRYAIERIKMILATAGTSLDNVLTVLTHLTKREDLAAYNEEYPLSPGYAGRRTLHQLYHLLNHLNHFGGSYGSDVDAACRECLR